MAVAFQLGIDNTSPTISYNPFFPNAVAHNATLGWTPYYTNSGFPSTSGLVGNGTSLQISSKDGSFFTITWFGTPPFSLLMSFPSLTFDRLILCTGTGIDLYGNATHALFDVSLDGSSTTPANPNSTLLASFSNLPLGAHKIILTAYTLSSPSSFIAFDRAVITSAVEVMNLDKWVNVSKSFSHYQLTICCQCDRPLRDD